MKTRTALLSLCSLATLALSAAHLTGCARSAPARVDGPRVVAPATDKQLAASFDRVKSLAGEWTMKGPDGKVGTACVIAVSSNGSVVREIMFPGSDHEMTNVYHMDGPDLIMTHYCAAGNQPRMRCTPAGVKADRLVFGPDAVTNLTAADQMYMAAMTLEFKPDGAIVQHWTSRQQGKDGEHATFELSRKK